MSFHSSRPGTITWLKNTTGTVTNIEEEMSSKYVFPPAGKHKLIISQPELADEGWYTCSVTAGNSNAVTASWAFLAVRKQTGK